MGRLGLRLIRFAPEWPETSPSPDTSHVAIYRGHGRQLRHCADMPFGTDRTYYMKISLFWVETAACPISGTVPQS